MLRKLIRWIGNEFMSGSGYEKRLHEELVKMRKAQEYTIKTLKQIRDSVQGIRGSILNKEKNNYD